MLFIALEGSEAYELRLGGWSWGSWGRSGGGENLEKPLHWELVQWTVKVFFRFTNPCSNRTKLSLQRRFAHAPHALPSKNTLRTVPARVVRRGASRGAASPRLVVEVGRGLERRAAGGALGLLWRHHLRRLRGAKKLRCRGLRKTTGPQA